MSKSPITRTRVRHPAVIKQFSARLRQAIAQVGISQGDLGEKLGGFRQETISRLCRGSASSVPIDLLVKFSGWVDASGISSRWLLLGLGPMSKAELPQVSRQGEQMNQAMAYSMLCLLAGRLGVNLEGILPGWMVMGDLPGGGIVTESLDGMIEKMEAAPPAPPAAVPQPAYRTGRPGYRTVPPEGVPTDASWHEHYVPVIGRIAAGEGVGPKDLAEATEYPPAWAGEFLVYDGAPASSVAVRVSGDSMEPTYHDGDMVIVDPRQPADSGEVCCVLLDREGVREARLKRLRLLKRYAILESLNPDPQHAPEKIPRGQLARAYKIVEHLPLIAAQ